MSILNAESRRSYHRVGASDAEVNDAIFEVDHLSLAYPRSRGQLAMEILIDISFKLKRGGALSLVGPSGSGKSSVLRCLNRLIEPSSGTVRFDGRDTRSLDPRELRRRVALVMQTPVMFEGTVRDNLCIRPSGVQGDFSEDRLRTTLDEVGLESALLDRQAQALSGGERQRVTIARALLRDPQALLLDEPTSALDPGNALLIAETVSRLCTARGLSIIAVTHQPDLVRRLGGAMLYLIKGRIEAFQSLDGADANAPMDARLSAFLAGEKIISGRDRP
jgi:putative ABC transport system ATP-binding protein